LGALGRLFLYSLAERRSAILTDAAPNVKRSPTEDAMKSTTIQIRNIPAKELARIEAFRTYENAQLPALRDAWNLPWLEESTLESAAYILILRALDDWERHRDESTSDHAKRAE
jgi:hypothetical protein